MNLFGYFKRPIVTKTDRQIRLSQTADNALKQYGTTFRDLARYDRGELDPVSR